MGCLWNMLNVCILAKWINIEKIRHHGWGINKKCTPFNTPIQMLCTVHHHSIYCTVRFATLSMYVNKLNNSLTYFNILPDKITHKAFNLVKYTFVNFACCGRCRCCYCCCFFLFWYASESIRNGIPPFYQTKKNKMLHNWFDQWNRFFSFSFLFSLQFHRISVFVCFFFVLLKCEPNMGQIASLYIDSIRHLHSVFASAYAPQ